MEVDLDTFSFVDSPGRGRERRIYKKKKKERIGKKKQEGNTIQRGQASKELVGHSDRINEESFAAPRDQTTSQTGESRIVSGLTLPSIYPNFMSRKHRGDKVLFLNEEEANRRISKNGKKLDRKTRVCKFNFPRKKSFRFKRKRGWMSRVEEWRDSFDFNPTRIILGITKKKKKKKIGKERRDNRN